MEEALTALLAPVAGGRRHWVRAPQGTPLPYVVMTRVSAVRDYTFTGDDGLVEYRVQIDAYAATYTSAADVARQVVGILSGYRNGAVRGVFVDGQRDLPAADSGEVNHLFRISTDILIWHRS